MNEDLQPGVKSAGAGVPALAALRKNKPALFALLGFIGGSLGALLAELIRGGSVFPQGVVSLVLGVAAWSAVFAACITTALCWAEKFYSRRVEFAPFKAVFLWVRAIVVGALCGAVAGAAAQACYSVVQAPDLIREWVVRPACWGLMGLLLGLLLTAVIPNLGTLRAVAGGLMGGVLGGFGFMILSTALAGAVGHAMQVLARMGGVGVLGAALGFAIVAVEAMFRQASLEVIWAPNETTTFTLGPKPVYIGGGDDHVFVAGLAQHHAGIVLLKGKVEYFESATGKRTPLKDSSRLDIGKLSVVVHAKS